MNDHIDIARMLLGELNANTNIQNKVSGVAIIIVGNVFVVVTDIST